MHLVKFRFRKCVEMKLHNGTRMTKRTLSRNDIHVYLKKENGEGREIVELWAKISVLLCPESVEIESVYILISAKQRLKSQYENKTHRGNATQKNKWKQR